MSRTRHPLREPATRDLYNGMPATEVSKKYNIALSTLTAWIKELPADATPSKFQYRNKMISSMRRVNESEARIADLISNYIVCDISDEEWESMMAFIQKELIKLVCDDK